MPIRFQGKLAVLLIAGAGSLVSGCGSPATPPKEPAPAAKPAPAAPEKPAAPEEKKSEPAPENDGGGPVLTPPATTSGESKSDSK